MRLLPISTTAASLVLALSGTAAATDFCVATPANCSGTALTARQLKASLSIAQTNGTADRYVLGAGAFPGGPFVYDSAELVEIVGAGAGATVLSGGGGTSVMALGGNPASSISDLGIAIDGSMTSGLQLTGTSGRRIAVTQQTGTSIAAAAMLRNGGRLTESTVTAVTPQAIGVGGLAGEGALVDSIVTTTQAPAVAAANNAHLTIARDTLRGGIGVYALGASVAVTDTLIDGTTAPAGARSVGLASITDSGNSASLDADRVTIVGSDAAANGAAAGFALGLTRGTATLRLHDAVLAGVSTPFARQADPGAVANVDARFVAHPDAVGTVTDSGPGSVIEANRVAGAPGFLDAPSADFHLRADSPLLDAGDPATAAASGSDRDGVARPLDGNGDCVARSDLGAYEYRRAPKAVATASTGAVGTGTAVGFSAAGSCAVAPGDALTFSWRFDDGAGATGPDVAHAFAGAGTHTATLTVTDPAGHAGSATAAVAITGTALAPPPAKPAPKPDRTKPVLGALRVPGRITLGSLLPQLRAGRRTPAVAFRLSERATVQLRFARRGRGGRFHGIRTTVRVSAAAGANRLRFSGPLTRRARLAPGRYRVTLTAVDAARNRSRAVSAAFLLVRAR
ncbi:MAG: glycosyl hydrolase [Conexibacter sp.]|nr:glycosyl hydrolase [Conexibacter sp.]